MIGSYLSVKIWIVFIGSLLAVACKATYKGVAKPETTFAYTKPCMDDLQRFVRNHWKAGDPDKYYMLSDSAKEIVRSATTVFERVIYDNDSCIIGSSVSEVIHLFGKPSKEVIVISKNRKSAIRVYSWFFPKTVPANQRLGEKEPRSFMAHFEVHEDTAAHGTGTIKSIMGVGVMRMFAYSPKGALKSDQSRFSKPCMDTVYSFVRRHWKNDTARNSYVLSDSARKNVDPQVSVFERFIYDHDSCIIGSTVQEMFTLLGEPTQVHIGNMPNTVKRVYIWHYYKTVTASPFTGKHESKIIKDVIEISEDTSSHGRSVVTSLMGIGGMRIFTAPPE